MKYCQYYYNSYMRFPCCKMLDDVNYDNDNGDELLRNGSGSIPKWEYFYPLNRKQMNQKSESITNDALNNKSIVKPLKNAGVSDEAIKSIITTIVKYTIMASPVPLLPLAIVPKASELTPYLEDDNPSLVRELKSYGLSINQIRQFFFNVIAFTLNSISMG